MNDKTDDLVAAHRADSHSPPPATVQRWHDALDAAAACEQVATRPERSTWHPTSIFMGMAIAATLALGIAIGFFLGDDNPVADVQMAGVEAPGVAMPVALSRGLQVHFRDSRQQIMNLPDAEDRTLLVLRIIEQNRMFENAAISGDAPKLARVLRAFEPILLQLAADDIAPADAAALQAQLAFEMNVMLTKLGAGSSDDSHTT
jgi:hypothetical protein